MINKSWDPIWEKIFSARSWGKYPPEELVRFTSRNFYQVKNRKKVKILDLGCGPGAASWYLAREGFSVCGIDGSPTAIELAKRRFIKEKLSGEFKVGDIIKINYPNDSFSGVVDICSIQHNALKNIELILMEIYRVLKVGGSFFGLMIAKDKNLAATWSGKIHFFRQSEIKKIFEMFRDLKIEYVTRSKNNQTSEQKFWIVEAKK